MKQITLLLFAFVLLAVSCHDKVKQQASPPIVEKDTTADVPQTLHLDKDSLLKQTGKEILTLLKNKDYQQLSNFFAPGDSVHFSPYAFIGSGTQTLSSEDFVRLLKTKRPVYWGNQDGSGDSIFISLSQYLEKFVYPADFITAPKTSIDTVIKTGNSLNNLQKAFPGSRFIEYHFPGFDKKYAGMDWTSLRLVFKFIDGRYYLQAFVHDQWTI